MLLLMSLVFSCEKEKGQTSEVVKNDSVPVTTAFGGDDGSLKGTTTIVADESLRALVEAERKNFEAIYQRAHIRVIYLPGESAVDTLLNQDSISLAILTRQLSKEETAYLESKSLRVRNAQLAYEGIAVIANPGNPDTLLSRSEITGILSGKIHSWKQLNPASPLGEILLVTDHPTSGIIPFLRDSVIKGAIKGKFFSADSATGVIDYVRNNPSALGFIGNSLISDRDDPRVRALRKGIVLAALQKPETADCAIDGDFFQPYQSYLLTGCYPWRRPVYSVLCETRFGLATGFVAYMDSDPGQRIIHKLGLAPFHSIPRLVKFPDTGRGTDIVP